MAENIHDPSESESFAKSTVEHVDTPASSGAVLGYSTKSVFAAQKPACGLNLDDFIAQILSELKDDGCGNTVLTNSSELLSRKSKNEFAQDLEPGQKIEIKGLLSYSQDDNLAGDAINETSTADSFYCEGLESLLWNSPSICEEPKELCSGNKLIGAGIINLLLGIRQISDGIIDMSKAKRNPGEGIRNLLQANRQKAFQ